LALFRKTGKFPKFRRIYIILTLFRKTGGFPKSWRCSEKQADFQNPGACRKSGGLTV
jgi:hypothetical protein